MSASSSQQLAAWERRRAIVALLEECPYTVKALAHVLSCDKILVHSAINRLFPYVIRYGRDYPHEYTLNPRMAPPADPRPKIRGRFCLDCSEKYAQNGEGRCRGCSRNAGDRRTTHDFERERIARTVSPAPPPAAPQEGHVNRTIVVDGVEYEVAFDGSKGQTLCGDWPEGYASSLFGSKIAL